MKSTSVPNRCLRRTEVPKKSPYEVKSFISHSNISELQRALGQFLAYKIALRNLDPERDLFLAVPEEIFNVFFREDLVDQTLELASAKIVVYDPLEEKIVTWKNY